MEVMEAAEEASGSRKRERGREQSAKRRRSDEKARERKVERREDEKSDTEAFGQESDASEVGSEMMAESLAELRRWLNENDVKGLSVAQMGAHLAIQIQKSGVSLATYMDRMLARPDDEQERERQRGVLPLPCLEDSKEAVSQALKSGEFKRLAGSWNQKKGMAHGKVHREMRKKGLLIWHFLVVTALNFLWNGMKAGGKVCHRAATKAQKMAQDRIWTAVRIFVDDVSEVKDKFVKAPGYEEWNEKLDSVRVSYQGDIIPKAQSLTLDQILPGLPPEGYGGVVQLSELCDGAVRDLLLHPEKCLLEGDELPVDVPRPKVHASEEEWGKIAGALYKRGLVRPVEKVAKVEDQEVLNGAFGVPKPGKLLEDGRDVLRLIMDFRGVNSVMKIIEGDVRTLTGAPALQHVVMPKGSLLRISADDLVSAFYLFALPKAWSQLMAFDMPVPWKDLGFSREGSTRIGACVLPMGWSSAVGLMQHAHRRLALRSPLSGGAGLLPGLEIRKDEVFPALEVDGGAAWSLYLDDMTILELLEEKAAKSVEGLPAAEQLRLREAYSHWGIPVSKEKALARAKKAEKLGAVLDGEKGLLRCSTKRSMDSLSLSASLMRREYPSKKAVQVYAGKEVHGLQFRRPLFSTLSEIWREIAKEAPTCRMGSKVVSEILLLGCLQAMKFTDLKASLSEVVTASDACESGGGTVYANKLSSRGLTEVVAIEEKMDEVKEDYVDLDGEQKILVFDYFAGIGGLSRSLQLAGIEVHTLVVIEQDADCRRLHRRRWPGCKLISDVKTLTKDQLRKMMLGVNGLTGVIAGGGSPCQGLSKLSVYREGLDDPRSSLFYSLAENLKWVQELAVELDIWSIRFGENVVGDDEEVQEMSQRLNMEPIEVCASDLSWVRRPRLYWGSVEIDDHPSFSREGGRLAEKLRFDEIPEELGHILQEGWGWPGAELNPLLRLPTFTRAIRRKRAPPRPAGISRCSEKTLDKWKKDEMMFPPYTYSPEYLVREKDGEATRVVNAQEREALMGFRPGYTLALFKKAPEDEREKYKQEVARMAAIGNSFHAVVMAVLLDLWLWSKKVRTDALGARAICNKWRAELAEAKMVALEPEEGKNEYQEQGETESEELALLAESRRWTPSWVRPSGKALDEEMVKKWGQQLVHHFLRRSEYRGSDVRLDLGIIYKPDVAPRTSIDPSRWSSSVADAYPYRVPDHINVLELRSILHALEWRARSSVSHSQRFLHLSDSQICLAVLTKGRSSSKKLNHLLRKICALCLTLNIYPLYAWIESRLNPADEPSRRFMKATDGSKSSA